mmetsp:Transcript_60244/g.196909  ORF Transcript_60244/g.196909 Transcript_60244/m.196909 type:complete len:370 (+) Transcript_60244:3027-4136(+)
MVLEARAGPEQVRPSDQLLEIPAAQRGHDFTCVLRYHEEEIDEVLRLTRELLTQLRILCCHTYGASVEMALPHHDAAQDDERRGGHCNLLRTQERGHDDVAARSDLPVRLHSDPVAQAVEHQRLVRLGHADLPRETAVLDGGPLGGAGAPGHARDRQVVGLALDNTRGDDPNADTSHQLHGDAGSRVSILEVANELRNILDRVHVVVRRRGDQANAGRGIAHLRDLADDLVAGQLASFAGLRPLRELDLDLVRVGEVLRGDAEATRGDLLDPGLHGVALENLPIGRAHGDLALLQGLEALRILAALARVAAAADAVQRHGHGAVRLVGDGAQRGGAGAEALDDLGGGLDLVQGHRVTLVQAELKLASDL